MFFVVVVVVVVVFDFWQNWFSFFFLRILLGVTLMGAKTLKSLLNFFLNFSWIFFSVVLTKVLFWIFEFVSLQFFMILALFDYVSRALLDMYAHAWYGNLYPASGVSIHNLCRNYLRTYSMHFFRISVLGCPGAETGWNGHFWKKKIINIKIFWLFVNFSIFEQKLHPPL